MDRGEAGENHDVYRWQGIRETEGLDRGGWAGMRAARQWQQCMEKEGTCEVSSNRGIVTAKLFPL